MTSITPSTLKERIGSAHFNDNTEVIVSYLNGINITKPWDRIHGLTMPCDITISVLDMRTFPDKEYWIIVGRILKIDNQHNDLVNTVQQFYYPRDSFMLANNASIP